MLLSVFLTCALSNCSRVLIKDKVLAGDLGEDGAVLTHTLNPDLVSFLTKLEWDNLRFGWYCMSPEDFAETKTEILKLCEVSAKCDYEQVKKTLDNLTDKFYTVKSSVLNRRN